jgi:hypothetical protein
MQERSAINVAHGLKKEGKAEEVEKKEEGVRDVEDVQDGDGKMHINIGLVIGLNILFLWSKLITYRSFFRYANMLLRLCAGGQVLKVLDVHGEMVLGWGCAVSGRERGALGLFHKSSTSGYYRYKLEWGKRPNGLHLALL